MPQQCPCGPGEGVPGGERPENWSPRMKRTRFQVAERVRRTGRAHRGTWTHGFGPDFRDAMIVIDGRDLVAGSIELHLRSGGWRAHGHHLDPRYNEVVL